MKTNIKPKFLSLLLVLSLLLSVTPVLAAEGDQTVPVDLTVEAPIFSVTVPIALPITITEDGSVVTSTTAAIINNSAGPVAITSVDKGINGWATVGYAQSTWRQPKCHAEVSTTSSATSSQERK